MKNLSLVIILLSLTALGCRLPGFLQQSNSSDRVVTSGNTSAPPAATENSEVAPTGDARADVIRASKKFLDESEFTAKMEGEGKTPMHIELSYEQPDRFHMISRQPGGSVQSETMIIGQDMYMKVGERWQKLPGALGKTVPQIRQFFDEKGLESLKDVTFVGEDSVGGQATYVYTYRNEAGKGGAPYPFVSKIWVRESDGLPAKIQVDYEGGELKTLSIVYDYDKAVSIEPPVN
jgi:hypothetical protein